MSAFSLHTGKCLYNSAFAILSHKDFFPQLCTLSHQKIYPVRPHQRDRHWEWTKKFVYRNCTTNFTSIMTFLFSRIFCIVRHAWTVVFKETEVLETFLDNPLKIPVWEHYLALKPDIMTFWNNKDLVLPFPWVYKTSCCYALITWTLSWEGRVAWQTN